MFAIEQFLSAETIRQIKLKTRDVIGQLDHTKYRSIIQPLEALSQDESLSLAKINMLFSKLRNEIYIHPSGFQTVNNLLLTYMEEVQAITNDILTVEALPDDVVLLINHYLNCSAQIQLRLAHPKFYNVVSLPLTRNDLQLRWQLLSGALGNGISQAIKDIQKLKAIQNSLYLNQPATILDTIRHITKRYSIHFEPKLSCDSPFSDRRRGTIIMLSLLLLGILTMAGAVAISIILPDLLAGDKDFVLKFIVPLSLTSIASGILIGLSFAYCIVVHRDMPVLNEYLLEETSSQLQQTIEKIAKNTRFEVQFNKTLKWLSLLTMRSFEQQLSSASLAREAFFGAFMQYFASIADACEQQSKDMERSQLERLAKKTTLFAKANSADTDAIQPGSDGPQQDAVAHTVIQIEEIQPTTIEEHVKRVQQVCNSKQFFYNKLVKALNPTSTAYGFFAQAQEFRTSLPQTPASAEQESRYLLSNMGLNRRYG